MTDEICEEEMSGSEMIKLACTECLTLNTVIAANLAGTPVCQKRGELLLDGRVGELTAASFATIIDHSELPVVVNLWTSWCGHCRNFEPVFGEAARKLQAKALLFKVETEEEPELVRRFAMMTTPTQVVFREGKEVVRQTGVRQLPLLMPWLMQYLS